MAPHGCPSPAFEFLLLCHRPLPVPSPPAHRQPNPRGRPAGPSPLAQEIGEQARLAGPLALNLIANYSLNIVSLSFVVSWHGSQIGLFAS